MRSFLIVLFLAASAQSVSALDPELKVPYQLKVVMRLGDHPDFTEHFRLDLKRDLQGSLQAALGNLGTVEVIDVNNLPADKWETIWKTVDEKGLAVLDTMNEITGTKTHFLKIDFVDGRYELQARQYDGTTGFVTPIVRKMQTHDRGFVARLAGLMIGQDFGIMATFDSVTHNKTVLRFRAGELGPLNKWVKKGDVFAILQIRNSLKAPPIPTDPKAKKSAPVQIGTRADNVLLQVLEDPKEGICPARMISRYDDLPPPRGVIGYRAIKLGTTSAPLKLQLVDFQGAPVKGPLRVFVRPDDFPDATHREPTVDQDGVYVSKAPFANVVFARVMLGDRNVARLPIEILDDRLEVRKIKLEAGAEIKDRLILARRDILGRITDGRLVRTRCIDDLSKLEGAGQNKAALDRAQSTLKILDAISGEVQEDIQRLQAKIAKDLPGNEAMIGDCEKQLQTLRIMQNDLKEHVETLETVVRQENDPTIQAKIKAVNEIIRRAELFSKQAEFDKALRTYEEALAQVKDDPIARKRIEEVYEALKKSWALREGDAQHAEARKWIYEVWPTLGKFRDLRDLIPTARKYFEKCKSVGDWRTVLKMQIAGQEVVNKFEAEVEMTVKNEAMDEAEQKHLTAMQEVLKDLSQLLRDVDEYVRSAAPKAPAK